MSYSYLYTGVLRVRTSNVLVCIFNATNKSSASKLEHTRITYGYIYKILKPEIWPQVAHPSELLLAYELVPEATEVRKDDVRVASADQKLAERAHRCTHEFCASTTRERMPVSFSAGRRAQHHIRRRVVGIRVLHMWEVRGIVESLNVNRRDTKLSTTYSIIYSCYL